MKVLLFIVFGLLLLGIHKPVAKLDTRLQTGVDSSGSISNVGLMPTKSNEIRIGDFIYKVAYSPNTLGEAQFPLDDDKGFRTIILPSDDAQLKESSWHEVVHACLHNHPHHFASKKELENHMNQDLLMNEETIAVLVGHCLAETDIR